MLHQYADSARPCPGDMTSPAPSGIAKFDSSSAMVRALALFLEGKDFPGLGQSQFLQAIVPHANRLPRRLRETVFARLGATEGVAPDKVGTVSADAIAEWMAGLYPRPRYPLVMIGSSSGAMIHLAAALGAPWLPQTFLTLVKQTGVHPDDGVTGMQAGREPAERFLAANPGVQLHHMHDPSQDRLMLRYITYFRPKFRLPPAYRAFIARSLEPNGTIVLVECGRRWPTTRLGERYVYQFGAVGGPTTDEYFDGGPRVEAYLSRYGSPRRRWEPPSPNGESPEAEWGFEPALRDEIIEFAQERHYRVLRLCFEDPEHLSPLVADFYRAWHRERGIAADRLVIESFILMEPYWTLRIGAVPFWMTFNMEPSLHWVRRYIEEAEAFEHVHLMLFAHGVNSVGLPPIEAWRTVLDLGTKGGSFLGVDPDAYPAHFAGFARYHTDIAKLPGRHPLPDPLPLSRFERFVEESGGRYPVRLEGPAARRLSQGAARAG